MRVDSPQSSCSQSVTSPQSHLLFFRFFCFQCAMSGLVVCAFWFFPRPEKIKNQKVTVLHSSHIHLSSQRNQSVHLHSLPHLSWTETELTALAVRSLPQECSGSPWLSSLAHLHAMVQLNKTFFDLLWIWGRSQPVPESMLHACKIRALPTQLLAVVSALTVQTTISHFSSLLELL